MKKISLILFTTLLIAGCNLVNPRKGNEIPIGYDILYYEARDSINSLTGELQIYKDSIAELNGDLYSFIDANTILADSLRAYKDSLSLWKENALVYKYKIERIKAYDKIVRNNSSQSKYFLGWVRRVLED